MEEAQLKSKMKKIILEISLAESVAKLRVLENGEPDAKPPQLSQPQTQHYAMNKYLENYQGSPDSDLELFPIKFAEM